MTRNDGCWSHLLLRLATLVLCKHVEGLEDHEEASNDLFGLQPSRFLSLLSAFPASFLLCVHFEGLVESMKVTSPSLQ